MTLWLLALVIFVSPSQPPEMIFMSTRTEAGCQQRAQEYVEHLPTKPVAVLQHCLYMPKMLGSI